MGVGSLWIGLLGSCLGLLVLGCGGESVKSGPASAAAAGSGGQSGQGVGSSGTMGGSAGAGVEPGDSAAPFCATETEMAAPTGCVVSVRTVDPVFTCGSSECAVKRAFELECGSLPRSPSLSATNDGAMVLAIAEHDPGVAVAQFMTIDDTGAHVEDVPELGEPSNALPEWRSLDGARVAGSRGVQWLFAGRAAPLTVLRGTAAKWTRSSILLLPADSAEALLTDVVMVDDELGFVSYAGDAPHLITWDGSCWLDQAVSEVSSVGAMALAVDEQRRAWMAWSGAPAHALVPMSLYVRSPDGEIEELLAGLQPGTRLRLLSGGLDGIDEFPLVAARVDDGIALFSRSSTGDPELRSTLLAEPADTSELGVHCPVGNIEFASDRDPCLDMTSCDAQWSEVSSAFDLVRTSSAGVFAAWVVYSSEGSYVLQTDCVGGELPNCTCVSPSATGTGTAELVLMRLRATEPVLSRFRFDMSGPLYNVERELVMEARGDTLLVVAELGGMNSTTLTYLEIDASSLP